MLRLSHAEQFPISMVTFSRIQTKRDAVGRHVAPSAAARRNEMENGARPMTYRRCDATRRSRSIRCRRHELRWPEGKHRAHPEKEEKGARAREGGGPCTSPQFPVRIIRATCRADRANSDVREVEEIEKKRKKEKIQRRGARRRAVRRRPSVHRGNQSGHLYPIRRTIQPRQQTFDVETTSKDYRVLCRISYAKGERIALLVAIIIIAGSFVND